MPQHWPMIGRDEDMAEVMALLDDRDAHGVALAGKAGVGKSRIAREAAERAAAAGWSVRTIAATATGRTVPLGACAQWIDDAGGTPAALVRHVGEAVIAGAAPGRVLVVVDDAHLLDDLSALVVHHLVDARAAKVVLTVRTGEPVPDAVSTLWKDRGVAWRDVEVMAPRQVAAVLAAAFESPPDDRCSRRFWDLTQGNMLFVRRLAEQEAAAGRLVDTDGALRWHGDVAVSGSLAELVETQVGALRDAVRDVIDVIAVAEPVDWRCLVQLVEQDAMEEAEQRGLIRVSGDDVFVGHPLFAEIRRARCGSTRLRRLRGRVAMAMADGGSAARLVERALLWLDSDLAPEPELMLSAARAANALLDFDVAERLFAAAADAGMGAQAQVSRALSLFMMSEGDSVDAALAKAPLVGDAGSGYVNDVVMRAMNALWTMRAPDEATRIVDEALLTERGERRHQLLVFRSIQLALAGRTVAVLDTLADVDDRVLGSQGTTMACLARCMAYGELGQPDRVVAAATRSLAVLNSHEDGAHLRGPVTEVLASGLAASGRVAEALDVAESFHRSRLGRLPAMRDVAAQILGAAHLAGGDLRAALHHLPDHFDPQDWIGRGFLSVNSFSRFHYLRAQALARVGDLDAAARAVEAARALHHPAYDYYGSSELLAEAWIAAAGARFGDARTLTLAAADCARDHQQWAREVWCLQTAVQFDHAGALERLTELAAQLGTARATAAARYAAALGADDAHGLDTASKHWEAMGDRLAAADAAAQSATSHRRAGRAGSAITAAARARRLASDCGGATSPALVSADFAAPFTNREREIVVLVARGMSNREIADTMCLSVRTVESHVYRASAKAGVAGRAGLRDLALH
ncbi:helix-turn-helix transcriptional regulator [Mycolicibacterium grossiae]|uniref:HTH luxR-type domain-containing protein n=1 Tax=Mycolicibacterium grossiae TaxID=1552759 RepID=A0A1E8Q984_9MYCO|nr:helix-turn-helix transcriptional regulator [Mycolicibacterium grossiae]OFJ55006.1 hypothetical protein BEL07_04420 [Mycolicibacterium grossiae]QEM47577.1 helix-turn-helix transcriptional regulator [Mycolicibacterium grossiae]